MKWNEKKRKQLIFYGNSMFSVKCPSYVEIKVKKTSIDLFIKNWKKVCFISKWKTKRETLKVLEELSFMINWLFSYPSSFVFIVIIYFVLHSNCSKILFFKYIYISLLDLGFNFWRLFHHHHHLIYLLYFQFLFCSLQS